MPKTKRKNNGEDAEETTKGRKPKGIKHSEFNPCRLMAKGRLSERRFWVEELVNADGRNYKDIFETSAKNWAKAEAKRSGGDPEELQELFTSNIPGTPSDTKRMLETLIPMVAKKFSQDLSYEFDDDGDITVDFSPLKGKKAKAAAATKTAKKAKVTAKSSDEDDEDEDSDDDSDEDEDDEDED